MSSMPPNPQGYPPYDPKTQWRAYREQQKAAWRAQREAWKTQRRAWQAHYWGGPQSASIVGPLILIAVGVVWLLIYAGDLSAEQFWNWYARWWPAILIVAGVALLGEWMLDLRRDVPVRRHGPVGLLILLVFLGMFAAKRHHMGAPGWDSDNEDFFNLFSGQQEHDIDQAALESRIPANASIEIDNPRGDVSITAAEDNSVSVQPHEVAYAHSDSDAQKIFASEAAHLTVSGSSVTVRSGGDNSGKVNLTITVPATAHVSVNAARGDVTASGLNAGIDINAGHGDARLSAINGPVVAHFDHNRHDFSAHQVNGDVTADGNTNDVTLSEIRGRVTLNGEIFGDVHIENVSGGVKIHTSVTDLDIAALPGDMTLDSDNLRVNEATGAVQLNTHAKDIDLNQIYGDTTVQDRDGTIAIEPAGAYAIDARNNKGDIEITLPPNAAGNVNGRTHNGEVVTDFALSVTGDQDKVVAGRIGAGGPRIDLSTEDGDLHLKKGPGFPSTPPAAESGASMPPAGRGRHLKSKEALPAQPVTQ
jgi:DUF4097 and DUF4098 domain-containing protein YvlB